MATIAWIIQCIFCIISTVITLISFLALYQLFSGLHKETEFPTQSVTSRSESATAPPSKNPNRILSFFKYTVVSNCITFCMICILINIDNFMLFLIPEQYTPIAQYLIWPLYYIGRILLSLIFIGRLHYTFKGSMFEYTHCTMKTLKVVWFLMPLSALLSIVFTLVPSTVLIGYIFGTLLILVDILLSFSLLIMYLKKLSHLIYIKDETIVTVMIKYSLLYTICFFSTLSVIIVFVFTLSVSATSDNGLNQDEVNVFLSLDSVINLICLWLNLNIGKKWYNTLCGYLENKCKSCCEVCSSGEDSSFMVEVSEQKDHTTVSTSTLTIDNYKPANIEIKSAETGNTAIIL